MAQEQNEFEGSDFEDGSLEDELTSLQGDMKDIESSFLDDVNVNEYGEIEDDDSLDVNSSNLESNTSSIESNTVSQPTTPTNNSNSHNLKSWSKRSDLAPNETDKEFEMFKVYCMYGGGRSHQYVSQITNFGLGTVKIIAQRNNWTRRSGDYDRWQLTRKIKEAQTSRHEEHIRKLEVYREEQEALGKQLTLNAARIAFLANSTLAKMLDEDKDLDIRDVPGILNTAAKLAEVGKNLQGTALGVDQLLSAIEDSEVD